MNLLNVEQNAKKNHKIQNTEKQDTFFCISFVVCSLCKCFVFGFLALYYMSRTVCFHGLITNRKAKPAVPGRHAWPGAGAGIRVT